jgi:TrmH family RNA methyltransferase
MITSTKNPKIQAIFKLQKPRERASTGLFTIEGVREVSQAIKSGYDLEQLLVCGSIYQPEHEYPIDMSRAKEVIPINQAVFEKLAYRTTTGGIIAVSKIRPLPLHALEKTKSSFFLIIEQVEKPGNMGAILRTADAAGVDGVILTDPATDFFNPNVIRSSLGCCFTVPVAHDSNQKVGEWLKAHGISTYAAALVPGSRKYYTMDYTKNCAIILGTEAEGLSDFWLEQADHKIIIPMNGTIDSINVSNAAAILAYEVVRQRNSNRQ